MESHATREELRQLIGRKLPAETILRVTRHIGACPACRELALLAARTDEHPTLDPELFAYAEGGLSRERRLEVERHLAGCTVCREDVADAQRARNDINVARPWRPLLAVAASLIVAFTLWMYRSPRRTTETPVRPAVVTTRSVYGRADWDALVATAQATGRIPISQTLRELQPSPDTLRGPNKRVFATLQPAGRVVESAQPELTWTPFPGESYMVTIADGDVVVARSPVLFEPRWIPARALHRGRTYAWQVELLHSHNRLPLAPAPQATFRLLDEATSIDLAAARRRFPDDHLLLGLLCAQAGVIDSARHELAAFAAAHPDDAAAQRLLRSAMQ